MAKIIGRTTCTPMNVDDALSPGSTNPVQNKVVWETCRDIDQKIKPIDDHLDLNSTNPVQNKVVSEKLRDLATRTDSTNGRLSNDVIPRITTLEDEVADLKENGGGSGGGASITVDTELDENSENPVQNKVVTQAIADMQPVRFTVTKVGKEYVASKTHQELLAILAENEHRSIICEIDGIDVPLNKVFGDNLLFANTNTIWDSITIQMSNTGEKDTIRVDKYAHSIEINGQLWDEDDPNADFTDTINEMIDNKIGDVDIAVDDELSTESTNPVQNKAITKVIDLMGELNIAEEFVPSKNLYNPVNRGYIVNWYIPLDDGLSVGDYNTGDYIEVKAGSYAVSSDGELISNPRYVLYDADKHAVRGKQNQNPIVITDNDIANGGMYIRVSVTYDYKKVQVEEGTEPTAYEPYVEPPEDAEGSFVLHTKCLPEEIAQMPERVNALEADVADLKESGGAIDEETLSLIGNMYAPEGDEPAFYLNRDPIGYFRATGDLVDGEELTLPENNVKASTVTVFSCIVDTLDKVYIGKKNNGTEKPYIRIDGTSVFIKDELSNEYTYEHGLTIGSNLLVKIETGETRKPEHITIISDNGSFEVPTSLWWIGDKGCTFVRSEGSTLTDCVLTWTSRNIAKPVWVFGDSYVSHTTDERWTYHLYADGYGNATMLNGYAGENSANALVSLKNLLTIGRPQYIIWALGMNDPDETDAVDSSWLSCFDEVSNLCKQMNIKLIACTIPQTPIMNNAHKNAIIRTGGHRYIDFESSVVKDTITGTWYDGFIDETSSNPYVHPTTAGAKALYYRVLCDFPEIVTL